MLTCKFQRDLTSIQSVEAALRQFRRNFLLRYDTVPYAQEINFWVRKSEGTGSKLNKKLPGKAKFVCTPGNIEAELQDDDLHRLSSSQPAISQTSKMETYAHDPPEKK
ncbi:hypothetical protein C0J52_27265 [Blattella germanica]|nr:hypothetical protein C0J52_27265 [Blattella germanica]